MPIPTWWLAAPADGRAVILPTFPKNGGGYRLARAIVTRINLRNVDRVMNAGDWDRDGHSDIIGRHRGNGALYIWTGHGDGTFDGVRLLARSFGRIDLLAAVGDVTGDGWPDLMGQPRGGPMKIYPGIGLKGHRTRLRGVQPGQCRPADPDRAVERRRRARHALPVQVAR